MELQEEGFLKADLHVHTKHSDGMSKVKTLIKKSRKLKIGFAITDHNEISGVIEAYKIKEKRDFIIPGIELHAKEGPHFLLFFPTLTEIKKFYKKEVFPNKKDDPISRTNLTIEDISKFPKKYDCIISIAHPEGRLWANIENMLKKNNLSNQIYKKVHAAEVLSGQQPKYINKKSFELADKYDLSFTGGSDAHSLMEFGKIVTIAHAKTIREFLNSIKKKQTFVIGKENKIYRKMIPQINIMRKHLKYAPPYIAKKLIKIIK